MEENFGPDFITVTDEDGNDFELELVDTLEHKGVIYYAMFPAVEEDGSTGEPKDVDADDEEYGLVIMKAIEENGEELLSTLDSDEELDEVYELPGSKCCLQRPTSLMETTQNQSSLYTVCPRQKDKGGCGTQRDPWAQH